MKNPTTLPNYSFNQNPKPQKTKKELNSNNNYQINLKT